MDIIDIIIAKAQANAIPVSIASLEKQAKQAVKDANAAVAAIDEIEDRATAAAETAESASQTATEAASSLTNLIFNYDEQVAAPMREDISNLQEAQITDYVSDFSASTATTTNVITTTLTANRNGKANVAQSFKNYQVKGQNTDGSMTQKAITNELNALTQAIENIDTSGSGTFPTFPVDDAGKILVVGEDGSVIASSLTEASLIETQIATNTYMPDRSIGLEIDYVNKTINYLNGSYQPDDLVCYTGRRRCVLDRRGNVVAYYGDSNYIEDGSLGEVMVELPPVWYRRVIIESAAAPNGQGRYIKKEQIFISDQEQNGFEIHPLFLNVYGQFVYVGAYEGYLDDDRQLRSIAGVQPTTNITYQEAETAATKAFESENNKLMLTTLNFESYNQLMMLMEFGQFNIQEAFYPGVSKLTDAGTIYTSAMITGSTAFLGNASGEAQSSVSVVNGVSTTYTESGKVSISYRGMENPYGNTWRYVSLKDTAALGLRFTDTVCSSDFLHYNEDFYLPTESNWVSTFNATTLPYFIPITSTITGDSSLLIGDYYYKTKDIDDACIVVGGAYNIDEQVGPFLYAINRDRTNTKSIWRGARLMYLNVSK